MVSKIFLQLQMKFFSLLVKLQVLSWEVKQHKINVDPGKENFRMLV